MLYTPEQIESILRNELLPAGLSDIKIKYIANLVAIKLAKLELPPLSVVLDDNDLSVATVDTSMAVAGDLTDLPAPEVQVFVAVHTDDKVLLYMPINDWLRDNAVTVQQPSYAVSEVFNALKPLVDNGEYSLTYVSYKLAQTLNVLKNPDTKHLEEIAGHLKQLVRIIDKKL
jgi:hypothetical protein